jgi:ribonuclease P protein component
LSLQKYGSGFAIVVRALPAAAEASWDQLRVDYDAALETTMKRLGSRLPRAASSVSDETTQEGTPRA